MTGLHAHTQALCGALLGFVVLAMSVRAGAATPAGTVPLPVVTAVSNAAALGHAANDVAYATVPLNLASYGYAQQEYLVSGQARVFDYADASGTSDSVTVLRTGPYTSRMLIRAPIDPARFSGNVVVELFNDALAGDQATAFPQAQAHFLRNGDIWVGITSNPTGIADLHSFNPVRYATLSFANPDPGRNAQSCPVAPTSTTEAGLIYDVISQTAALLRSPSTSNPLHDYNVKALYAAGYSGSALILLTYVDAIEPTLTTAPFDGYMVTAGEERQPLNECAPGSEATARSLVPSSARAAVFQVQTESEVALEQSLTLGAAFPHQADSDAANNRYRFYEIAGSSHVDGTLVNGSPDNADEQASVGTTLGPVFAGCDQPGPVSRFPDTYVYDNLWAKLEGWVRNGASPPHAAPFASDDILGNLLNNLTGGVRSPAVDVPVATYVSGSILPLESTIGQVTMVCPLLGYELDDGPLALGLLYGNKQNYVARVTSDAASLLAQGFLEQADAQAIVAAAAGPASPMP